MAIAYNQLSPHDSCDVKCMAAISPTSLPAPPVASSPSIVFKISPNVSVLPLCHDVCPVMPNEPHTTLDATASLNDTLMKQLKILYQMSASMAKLCELLDLTFGVLVTPNSAPQIHALLLPFLQKLNQTMH